MVTRDSCKRKVDKKVGEQTKKCLYEVALEAVGYEGAL